MPLDRQWIEGRIPHRGRMCLLDAVLEWNADMIRCRASSHRDTDNPLRAGGRLGIACGIEYAAQAMAVHSALAVHGVLPPQSAGSGENPPGATTTRRAPAAGFLAAVRNVEFHTAYLDDVRDDLLCEAARIAGDSGSALYDFELRGMGRILLRGRATVVLDAGERLTKP